MTERLLQYIWQFRHFARTDLLTTAGELVLIISHGQYNSNQGPDFANARIRIGETTWAGTVELHIRSSDWEKHQHQYDKNYDNVILHVVWEDDGWQYPVPVLELKGRVPGVLLKRYEDLMETNSFIPCEQSIAGIGNLTWKSWKDRLLAERLQRKAAGVQQYLSQNGNHWEEACWRMLARNFGTRVNMEAFELMARSVPVSLLSKRKHPLQQLEALLLGQAGLLEKLLPGDAYYVLLQREYRFLQSKYKIKPVSVPVYFLRMRPGNFPTVRLAQLAALLYQSAQLFTKIKEAASPGELRSWFDVTASDYWHYHYSFERKSVYKPKNIGAVMADNIIINTVCPLLFAYGTYRGEPRYKDKALQWLEQITCESNSITRGFVQLGVENKNAFDSQALIELKSEYCSKKRCLDCGVGNVLLKGDKR
ncbi:MAG: DUF2851 family protein [Sphingobacteriales bacterium]|nr:DUF2851 family protein [Sphingobacteriales bacterium]